MLRTLSSVYVSSDACERVRAPHSDDILRRRNWARPLRRPVYRYSARPLTTCDVSALDAALRLRHRVFAQELGWVPASATGREHDRCDPLAQHFAVFARCEHGGAPGLPMFAGYARVLLPEHGLMLQHEFRALGVGAMLPELDGSAFEVSRFVVDAHHRGLLDASHHGIVEHLARCIVRWALARGRTEWLSVCEVRHVRALRMRGLPFVTLGRVVEYQPGVPVCAAQLDLVQAAARLRQCRPRDYAWYLEGGDHDA